MSLMGILDRVADVATFDKAIEPARRAVQSLPDAVKDALHGTWLGHPLHPVLVQVPVGSWVSAGLLDAVPPLRPAATVLIGTGVAAAVPAALSGAADWSEQGSGVRRLGALHALANTAALGLYVGSLVARGRGRGTLGRVLSYAGLGIATGSAAIGGHMSYAQSSGASHAATAARALSTDWIDLGPLDDLPEGRPALRTGPGAGVDVPLVAVRRGTRVDAFIGACSHLSGPLHEGAVEEVRGHQCLVCPWHGSAFDLDNGEPRRGPAANPQEKLETRMEAGRVMARLPGHQR
ncbi:Rieske (2Fe-2S) protein [Geodermatophilus sabuli]|uniref:Ferredoxin subunit of nitrite reductase or a ring-hydroxylating dioxygenase n=1 Tax=Geodermatophilus sabuli TaxID=1564158 RepID=A0A285EBA0_9ACTN|nr:Rieske (2Fe-2S) protein [Geodermatophilus sabuli]MBB3085108.1 nitrite reductase/ring-hydroxylating ferredoxin subunit [Geodermatophilus sabuli]SNX95484.1 Ferredoxin subunit of nitrite reductase or a ring-hydroxylating dioxygenase [Geodermatophilus sabuli]